MAAELPNVSELLRIIADDRDEIHRLRQIEFAANEVACWTNDRGDGRAGNDPLRDKACAELKSLIEKLKKKP